LLALSGFLIVRSLTKHDYALFAIANSMQVTGSVLSDLGVGIGLRSIGGRVWKDPERFGQLVHTALGLRRRFAFASLAFTLPLSAWMLWHNGASLPLSIGLCLSISAGIVPLLGTSVFTMSLQLHSQYRRMQHLDLSNAVLRLAMIAGLAASRIDAIAASLVGVLGNWVQFIFSRRWTRELANTAAPANAEDRRELLRLSWKSLPNAVFFCFQGQVTLLILTWLGSPNGIADVIALGRIAVLFTVLTVTFNSVLAPRFTRCQDTSRLPHIYLLLVGGMILALAPLVLIATLFPDPFLWLLGSKYSGLQNECGWVVGASCVAQMGTVMWSLNTSRGWIRLQSLAFIPAIIGAQIIAASLVDLRVFHNVLVFNLVSAAAPLPVYLVDAFFGLKRGSTFHSASGET